LNYSPCLFLPSPYFPRAKHGACFTGKAREGRKNPCFFPSCAKQPLLSRVKHGVRSAGMNRVGASFPWCFAPCSRRLLLSLLCKATPCFEKSTGCKARKGKEATWCFEKSTRRERERERERSNQFPTGKGKGKGKGAKHHTGRILIFIKRIDKISEKEE
jgi:hypothetical protein